MAQQGDNCPPGVVLPDVVMRAIDTAVRNALRNVLVPSLQDAIASTVETAVAQALHGFGVQNEREAEDDTGSDSSS
jgi:hypothetical protein